jgi:diguanylate cyclase (GGDEF)-like protein
MCDIDHFKNFNDTFGHEAGDLVMKAIGRVLLARVRADDLACRYGGEEFTIILPGASLSATIKRAEALLTRIRTIKLTYEGKALDSISMSMGIAMYPDNGENNQALLRSADAALFRAKHNGRDRVETAE